MIEPLRMAFEVDCPARRAFDLWTQRASSWWPVAHTVTTEPGVQVVFEAWVLSSAGQMKHGVHPLRRPVEEGEGLRRRHGDQLHAAPLSLATYLRHHW
jgi:hypothetical protein